MSANQQDLHNCAGIPALMYIQLFSISVQNKEIDVMI